MVTTNKSLLNLAFATEMEKLQDVWCFFTLCSNEDPYYVPSIGPPFPYSGSLSSIKYINLIKSHIIPFAYSLFALLLPQHLTVYQTMDQMVLVKNFRTTRFCIFLVFFSMNNECEYVIKYYNL